MHDTWNTETNAYSKLIPDETETYILSYMLVFEQDSHVTTENNQTTRLGTTHKLPLQRRIRTVAALVCRLIRTHDTFSYKPCCHIILRIRLRAGGLAALGSGSSWKSVEVRAAEKYFCKQYVSMVRHARGVRMRRSVVERFCVPFADR